MKLLRDTEIGKHNGFFDILTQTERSQIASMVLQPGETSGPYGNEHANSDQIMYVVEGEAIALVEGKEHKLLEDDVILIAAGEQHQIRCVGHAVLRTVNVYSPPGY